MWKKTYFILLLLVCIPIAGIFVGASNTCTSLLFEWNDLRNKLERNSSPADNIVVIDENAIKESQQKVENSMHESRCELIFSFYPNLDINKSLSLSP